METAEPGLGTQLRILIAKLDGDVQLLYDAVGASFRPRFFPIVQHLIAGEPCTVTTLAQVIQVSQPAATQTIAEMVKLGLIDVAAGTDARERLVSLTPAGRELAEQLRPLWGAVAEAASDLDRELPYPLSKTLAAALDALGRDPFADRVRRKINDA